MKTTEWLQDTEGRQVARIALTPDGEWMILPEPDYSLVIIVETGVVKMWDRKNNRPVEMEGAPARDDAN